MPTSIHLNGNSLLGGDVKIKGNMVVGEVGNPGMLERLVVHGRGVFHSDLSVFGELNIDGNSSVTGNSRANLIESNTSILFGGTQELKYTAATASDPDFIDIGNRIIQPPPISTKCMPKTQASITISRFNKSNLELNSPYLLNSSVTNFMSLGFDGTNGFLESSSSNSNMSKPSLKLNSYCGNNVEIGNGSSGDLTANQNLKVAKNAIINGQVGIGVNSPAQTLEVRGISRFSSNSGNIELSDNTTNGLIESTNDLLINNLSGKNVCVGNSISGNLVANHDLEVIGTGTFKNLAGAGNSRLVYANANGKLINGSAIQSSQWEGLTGGIGYYGAVTIGKIGADYLKIFGNNNGEIEASGSMRPHFINGDFTIFNNAIGNSVLNPVFSILTGGNTLLTPKSGDVGIGIIQTASPLSKLHVSKGYVTIESNEGNNGWVPLGVNYGGENGDVSTGGSVPITYGGGPTRHIALKTPEGYFWKTNIDETKGNDIGFGMGTNKWMWVKGGVGFDDEVMVLDASKKNPVLLLNKGDLLIYNGMNNRILLDHFGNISNTGNIAAGTSVSAATYLAAGTSISAGSNIVAAGFVQASQLIIRENSLNTSDYLIECHSMNPNAKLFRLNKDGIVSTHEVVVDTDPTNWPDYVFEKDYHLTSLTELEEYLPREKHLPGMPSAKEIAKSGIYTSKMFEMQQLKLEETTLYVIDLQNQINELKKSISNLSKK